MTCRDLYGSPTANRQQYLSNPLPVYRHKNVRNPRLANYKRAKPTEKSCPPPYSHNDLTIGPRCGISILMVRERVGYLQMLQLLGFNGSLAVSILHHWVSLKVNAPAGGPYGVLGAALAAIAELNDSCTVDMIKQGQPDMSKESEWESTFAQVLNYEALRTVRAAGVYLAPDFTKAKWMVYRLLMRRWEILAQH
ncbi:hypothetical protein F5Y18DRAFT_318173 [Xylariaceae sp. FL1019]|nr:hypothetical protein F5Y18DRAFT_318173 [Xylariaceae sp. FL1019]